MRKFVRPCALLLALVVSTSGCISGKIWAVPARDAWELIGPEYTNYLDNDPNLTAESKAIRKGTATQLTDVLDKAAGVKD